MPPPPLSACWHWENRGGGLSVGSLYFRVTTITDRHGCAISAISLFDVTCCTRVCLTSHHSHCHSHLPISLVPWPHPQRRKKGLVNFGLGSWAMARADWPCKAEIRLVSTKCIAVVLLYSCGKLVIWSCQSCDLIGIWKFLRPYTNDVAFLQ